MGRAELVGIINVTPDSFSGDGTLLSHEALDLAKDHINDGASYIDVGAQSTIKGGGKSSSADS